MFVHRTTSQVMRREADLDVLVELNRTMMQGLSARPEAA
ncbi:MAG TPA: flagellar biosynthesis regulator FlaF [Caulobacteraceae bacterium]|nr:flagellar biosynthesis regulator FlaF [Caulobacteraceae bacterium]